MSDPTIENVSDDERSLIALFPALKIDVYEAIRRLSRPAPPLTNRSVDRRALKVFHGE